MSAHLSNSFIVRVTVNNRLNSSINDLPRSKLRVFHDIVQGMAELKRS